MSLPCRYIDNFVQLNVVVTFLYYLLPLASADINGFPSQQDDSPDSRTVVSLGILGAVCIIGIFILWAIIRKRLAARDRNRIPDVNDPEIARAEASLVETLDEAARQNYERARSKNISLF